MLAGGSTNNKLSTRNPVVVRGLRKRQLGVAIAISQAREAPAQHRKVVSLAPGHFATSKRF